VKQRRRSGPHINHERWLVSYADFVTLLFAFFVVLYASAQLDRQKAMQLSEAINSAFQHVAPEPHSGELPSQQSSLEAQATRELRLSSPAETSAAQETARRQQALEAMGVELNQALAAEIANKQVSISMGADGLVVSLREMGFYDSGSATIKPGAEDAFRRLAHILQEHPQQVRVEGHSDNVPIHTPQFASNWELSTARATGVVRRLIEDYGISGERLSAAGYAEFHPVADNGDPKDRQFNRRVDVVILR
jgi:chemotaxis protein MotB